MAIFGTGSVGLAAVMAAQVVGVDIHRRRLELARDLRATHCIENRDVDLAERIRAVTGSGVDHLVETTGDEALHRVALDLLNPGGRLALLTGARGANRLPGGRKVLRVIQGDAVPQRASDQVAAGPHVIPRGRWKTLLEARASKW